MTYYKAVRPDGTSFHDPRFRWLPEGWRSGDPIPDGWTVKHPYWSPTRWAAGYLSVSVTPTNCTGMDWPCVLLEVEPLGEVITPEPEFLPDKRAGVSFRVVRELPATEALGPQGAYIVALIERSRQLTTKDALRLTDAEDAAWKGTRTSARDAIEDAAWRAAWMAVMDAARDAAGDAAWRAAAAAARAVAKAAAWKVPLWDAAEGATVDAVLALVVRDLITREHYDVLTRPWRTAIGPIHPDDNTNNN